MGRVIKMDPELLRLLASDAMSKSIELTEAEIKSRLSTLRSGAFVPGYFVEDLVRCGVLPEAALLMPLKDIEKELPPESEELNCSSTADAPAAE